MDETPGVVRALLSFSQRILASIGDLVRNPELLAATRVTLNLPPSQTDTAAVNQRLEALDAKLRNYETRPGESLALDEQTLEILAGGTTWVELVELLLTGKKPDAEDPRTYADITYALITVLASESLLRPKAPWAWAALRLLMVGYERVEEVPRFDPFHIFDRMRGNATKVANPGFGPMEALGGLIIPPVVSMLDMLMASTISEQRRTFDLGYKKGTPYLAGDFDYKLGWDPSPDTPDELQELLARALTLSYDGKLKFHEEETEYALGFVVTLLAIEKEDGGPGFIIRGGAESEFKQELPPAANGAIKRELEFKAAGGPGYDYLWNTDTGAITPLGGSGGAPSIEGSFKWDGTEAIPAFRIGERDKHKLDLKTIKFGFQIGSTSVNVYLEVKGGEVVVKLSELLPFFKEVGADKIGGKIDAKLKYDSEHGLVFEGEAALKARLASHMALFDALRFDYLDLELGASDKKGISLGLASAARFKLGAFVASIDRTGIAAVLEDGKVRVEFKPPKGIGLRLDLEVVSGGGFLRLDYDKGEFEGAFQLSVKGGFQIQAIVIITTKVPGGKTPFALFVAGYFRFPPPAVELGLRFTLNAIGMLIGMQHGFDRVALENALPSGAMDDALFPEDIVGDAPRIIESLRTIFPITRDALTIAVMLEVGWGSDEICSIRIGLVFPFENVSDGPDFKRVVLLGRVAVTAFKSVPKPVRLQLIGDFIGEVTFDPFSIRFYSRLRDSRIGPLSLEGAYAVSLRTGSNPRLIFAAGGFHPSFKQVPADLPSPIDRLAVTWDIGVIKCWARAYFAVAPGTVQFGAAVGIRYVFGPLQLGGELELNALIYLPPAFAFEAALRASVYVKFRGRELMGVGLEFTLWGPARWRAKGIGHFTFIFVKIPIRFDESWGDQLMMERERTNVAALVSRDLKEPSNWRLELPTNASPYVSLAGESARGDSGALAHPLSVLSFTQRRIPFALELQRYGASAVEGPTLFPVPTVTDAADRLIGRTSVLTEAFPIAEYRDLSDEDRLVQPGFQTLAAGVKVGSEGYLTPAAFQDAPLQFEEIFRDTGEQSTILEMKGFDRDSVTRLASAEAAGRCAVRFGDKIADRTLSAIGTQVPSWIPVEPEALEPAAVAATPAWAATSPAFVSTLHAASKRGLLMVEDFEVGT